MRISIWEHEVLLNYLGEICVYCGSRKGIHIHHIIPLYVGGRNEMGNLEIVCRKCHVMVHKEIMKLFPYAHKKVSFIDGV